MNVLAFTIEETQMMVQVYTNHIIANIRKAGYRTKRTHNESTQFRDSQGSEASRMDPVYRRAAWEWKMTLRPQEQEHALDERFSVYLCVSDGIPFSVIQLIAIPTQVLACAITNIPDAPWWWNTDLHWSHLWSFYVGKYSSCILGINSLRTWSHGLVESSWVFSSLAWWICP